MSLRQGLGKWQSRHRLVSISSALDSHTDDSLSPDESLKASFFSAFSTSRLWTDPVFTTRLSASLYLPEASLEKTPQNAVSAPGRDRTAFPCKRKAIRKLEGSRSRAKSEERRGEKDLMIAVVSG
ncbi:hypothetical protein AAFF_G00026860 [Aldrovandia affinis]|uniref:Uncharacterized protein n=1 Tax=Aldrovandia affinis TaxID=143900 RepID=A0AAD7S4W8_9TELE|nr:hypothetical protein AAFF_G00026860 [Aldrovandia affinis]